MLHQKIILSKQIKLIVGFRWSECNYLTDACGPKRGAGCGGRGGVQVASSGTGGADGGTTATAPAAAPTSAPAASSQADPFDSLDMDMEELLLTPWRRLGQYPLRRWLGQPASLPLATVPRRRSKRLRPLPCIAARSAASAA